MFRSYLSYLNLEYGDHKDYNLSSLSAVTRERFLYAGFTVRYSLIPAIHGYRVTREACQVRAGSLIDIHAQFVISV